VIQALLELDCIPAGMELFPASDEERWSLITRVIDDCDYYIVIIGGRYGSVDEKGISYTEREYDYAVKRGIPVLAFLHSDADAIPAGKTELQQDARERLAAFRQKVEQRMCRHWRTPDDLGGVVSRSLVQAMKLQPGEGWVRGRFASDLRRSRGSAPRSMSLLLASNLPGSSRLSPPGTSPRDWKNSESATSPTLRTTWPPVI